MGRFKILVSLIAGSSVVTLSAASCGGGTVATSGGDGSAATDGTTSSNTDGTASTGADGSGIVTPIDSGAVNGANCPGTAPNNQASCAAGDGTCTYGNAVCVCGQGANPVWTCTTCPACPATEPDAGTCTVAPAACAAIDHCVYNNTTECDCVGAGGPGGPGGPGGGNGTWTCGTCPTTEPTGACTTADLSCSYDTTTCTCRRAAGGDAWVCVTPPPACPTAEPTAGGACVAQTGGVAGCVYGKSTCRCLPAAGDAGDEWSCN